MTQIYNLRGNKPSDVTTVQDLGEQGLLSRLQKFCPPEIVGDDGALVSVEAGKSLVVTTDILVDNVHFSDRTTPAKAVGWRAAAANLSDLAAMGATPVGITVGLSLRPDTTLSWLEALYQGINSCLQPYQTSIVGGDICRSSINSIAITAFGQVAPQQVLRRSTARPGDAIVVTGFHGDSRAGLELLLNPPIDEQLSVNAQELLIAAHRYPRPRLDVLPYLWQLNSPQAITAMDSSDGLADAVVQICQLSGVGAKIERSAIPLSLPLQGFVSPEKALEWALYGGEDFELVLCLREQLARYLVGDLGVGAAIIGKITAELNVKVVDSQDFNYELSLTQAEAFQHFS